MITQKTYNKACHTVGIYWATKLMPYRLVSYCNPMGLLPDTQNCGLRMRRECRERFPRHRLQRPPVGDPDMHYGTCVTHVPWCMSGSLTRGDGENVPGIPGACAIRNIKYLVRGPLNGSEYVNGYQHDHVIKWKHFPCYWPFVGGIHRLPVNSTHKGQWHGALMFSLISDWINGWVNNRDAGDLRRHRAHYDVIVMRFVMTWQGWDGTRIVSPGNGSLATWASYQIRQIAGCECSGNAGNVFPATDFKGNR